MWLRPKKHFVTDKAKKEYNKYLLKGGVLFASNHESFKDSVYLQMAYFLRHHVVISAKDVLSNMKAKNFLKLLGTIEINRETPSTADFRAIVSDLKKGYVVNIFPEGKVGDGTTVGEIKEGVILMAKNAGVPILPCYMIKRSRVHFYIGEPIYFDDDLLDKEKRKEIAAEIKGFYEHCKKI